MTQQPSLKERIAVELMAAYSGGNNGQDMNVSKATQSIIDLCCDEFEGRLLKHFEAEGKATHAYIREYVRFVIKELRK